MTKYASLGDFLVAKGQPEIKLSFLEIEKILNFKLPHSAYTYPAWWSNDNTHSQAKSWLNVGFMTRTVNIPNKTVLFSKNVDN